MVSFSQSNLLKLFKSNTCVLDSLCKMSNFVEINLVHIKTQRFAM